MKNIIVAFGLIISLFLLNSCGTKTTPTYEITTLSTPFEGGEIKLSPSGKIHDEGTSITLTAEPSEGYLFSSWTMGVLNSEINPLTITLDDFLLN